MNRCELEDKIIDIVRLQLNLDIPDINLDSTFEELDMDALDYIEIEMTIESELDFKLPNNIPYIYKRFINDSEAINVIDVKDLVDYVESILNDGKQF